MPASILPVFLKLQQLVLDSEDKSTCLKNLLLNTLPTLISINLNFEFLGVVFLDENNKIYQSEYVDTLKRPATLTQVLDLNSFLDPKNAVENELLWGKVFEINNPATFFIPTYPEKDLIKKLIVIPILSGHKVTGITLLGSKETFNITEENSQILKLLGNLINIAFKVQDTQVSLTTVSQEVYKMNVKLHDLDKLKDDFVSIASHELRTPMTAIRSYAWMALNRSDVPLSEKLKKYLSRTLLSTERLILLVNDMLNISRIESGRIEIIPKPFNMEKLIDDVFAEIEVKAKEKNINISMIRGNTPDTFADPDKVHQILLNLLGNALKFTPNGGEISVTFQSDGKCLDTSIKDTGTGMVKEDVARLFRKFGRLDNSYVAAATSGGTGLGLYICKSLIGLMRGKIWANSEGLGKGSTFTFSLPIATPEVLKEAAVYTKKVGNDAKMLEPVTI